MHHHRSVRRSGLRKVGIAVLAAVVFTTPAAALPPVTFTSATSTAVVITSAHAWPGKGIARKAWKGTKKAAKKTWKATKKAAKKAQELVDKGFENGRRGYRERR